MALSSVYSIGTRACLFTMVQKQVNSVVIWLTVYGAFGAQVYLQDHGMVALALAWGMALRVLTRMHSSGMRTARLLSGGGGGGVGVCLHRLMSFNVLLS